MVVSASPEVEASALLVSSDVPLDVDAVDVVPVDAAVELAVDVELAAAVVVFVEDVDEVWFVVAADVLDPPVV